MTNVIRIKQMTAALTLLLALAWLTGCTTTGPTAAPAPAPAASTTLTDSTPLKVGVSTNMPPLIYKQGDQITGLEAELAKGLAGYLGRPLQFVEVAWKDQVAYLLEGRTDIIMSGLSITELRKVRIAFCDPYSRTGLMAILRRGDIQRFKMGYFSLVETPAIGAIEGTTGEGFVRSRYEKARKRFFTTSQDAIQALRDKSIDLFIHDAPVVMVMAATYESELSPLYSLLTEEYLAWGVRRDDTALRERANAYIAALKRDGRLKSIVQRWMPLSGQ